MRRRPMFVQNGYTRRKTVLETSCSKTSSAAEQLRMNPAFLASIPCAHGGGRHEEGERKQGRSVKCFHEVNQKTDEEEEGSVEFKGHLLTTMWSTGLLLP